MCGAQRMRENSLSLDSQDMSAINFLYGSSSSTDGSRLDVHMVRMKNVIFVQLPEPNVIYHPCKSVHLLRR